MKAVAHSFTLSATLNPTDTGLTSDPVKGKKTGDILTAGEWNRVLELVSEGGGSGGLELWKCTCGGYINMVTTQNLTAGETCVFGNGGTANNVQYSSWSCTKIPNPGNSGVGSSGWVNVPLTDASDFDSLCSYRLLTSGGIPETIAGTNYRVYPITIGLKHIVINSDSGSFGHIYSDSKSIYRVNGSQALTVQKMQKLCGGGGGTSGGTGELVMSEMSPTTYSQLIDAVNYCRNLTENGITNWKFPSYGDLVNFIDPKYPQDMVWVADFDGTQTASHYINKDFFASIRMSDGYWSVTGGGDGSNKVRCVAQTGGGGGGSGGFGTAWVNFDGTQSAITMKGASGIASVTKVSAGNYQINFSTPKANTDYGVICTSGPSPAYLCFPHTKTTTGVLIKTSNPTSNVDASYISVVIN